MPTILPKKAGYEVPTALDDDHYDALASDPSIQQFPQGSTFGDSNATNTSFGGATSFGTPSTGGFGATSGGFGATSGGFGATSGGFGSPTLSSSGFGGNSGFGASASVPTQSGSAQVVHNQAESLKSGGGAMSQGGESTVAVDKDATDWINKKMRPMMGWIYMLTCTCDFVIFPVLWSLLQALSKGQVTSQWQPLTLQGAGLYHIAMGAVLGIAAYGRTKEKVAGVA